MNLSLKGIHTLPNDYRSLLRTPRHIEISPAGGGKLWYNSIRTNLETIFSKLDEDIEVALNINVDGIPLFKSSQRCFWPILASIHGDYLLKMKVSSQMNRTCFFPRNVTHPAYGHCHLEWPFQAN